MSQYSIVAANTQLSRLSDRAIAGEIMTITRDGTPVATIAPVARRVARMNHEAVARLTLDQDREALDILDVPRSLDASMLVSRMDLT